MISIKNERAAAEASRMSRELIETALGAFAGIPAGIALRRLLADVNIDLREAKTSTGLFSWSWPYETAEVSFTDSETAGSSHAQAIRELTRTRTTELASDLSSGTIAQVRDTLRNELAAEHERLSRPLRMGRVLPGARNRRQAQREALTQRSLDTLCDVPLSGPLFDETLASVLKVTGIASFEPTDALKEQALSRHREFQTRRETILMLAWEAIATEDGDQDTVLGLADRRSLFTRAKAKARLAEEKASEERFQAAEKKRDEELRKKRALIAREQEQRRRWDEMTRPKWSPNESEVDNDFEFGG